MRCKAEGIGFKEGAPAYRLHGNPFLFVGVAIGFLFIVAVG